MARENRSASGDRDANVRLTHTPGQRVDLSVIRPSASDAVVSPQRGVSLRTPLATRTAGIQRQPRTFLPPRLDG